MLKIGKSALMLLLFCALSLSPLEASQNSGATVYSGGFIYGKIGAEAIEAVVVQNGRFAYAGSLEGALQAAGWDCKRVDLEGRVMLPSFFDAHAHPDTQVLRGTGWDNAAFPDAPPNKALLDRVSAEIPIFIRSFDQHSAWVNSKALEMPDYRGKPIWPADMAALRDAFGLCEENGLRVHIHVVGDAAVQLALDGLQTLKTTDRHAVTHLELVDAASWSIRRKVENEKCKPAIC